MDIHNEGYRFLTLDVKTPRWNIIKKFLLLFAAMFKYLLSNPSQVEGPHIPRNLLTSCKYLQFVDLRFSCS